jgi:hypothetical protein
MNAAMEYLYAIQKTTNPMYNDKHDALYDPKFDLGQVWARRQNKLPGVSW